MSTLTASSTRAEIMAAYDDNASFEEDASPTKARAFITACTFLMRRMAKHSAQGGAGGDEVDMDVALIDKQKNDARAWLAAHGDATHGGARVTHVDFSEFRR